MNRNPKDIRPIEVDFYDVNESSEEKNVNMNNVTKSKKSPFKLVGAVLQKKTKVIKLVTKALLFVKKLGNISFLKKWILDIPALCDMLIDSINGVYKDIPYSSLIMVALAIIYTISPIDLLWDRIPILGVLDDAFVLKSVLNTIKNDIESYTLCKKAEKVA